MRRQHVVFLISHISDRESTALFIEMHHKNSSTKTQFHFTTVEQFLPLLQRAKPDLAFKWHCHITSIFKADLLLFHSLKTSVSPVTTFFFCCCHLFKKSCTLQRCYLKFIYRCDRILRYSAPRTFPFTFSSRDFSNPCDTNSTNGAAERPAGLNI